MTEKCAALYTELKERFEQLIADCHIDTKETSVITYGLTPEEAIGITERKDYPILTGKDVMLQATYRGARGQAFTDAPADYSGTLEDILSMDILADEHARGLFFASMNAVMRHLGLIEGTVHCRGDEPPKCAGLCLDHLVTLPPLKKWGLPAQ